MENREAIDLDLSRYLLTIKRHWLPAVIVFVSTLAVSAVATTLIKPSYQAEAKLLFKNSSFKVAGASLSPSNQEGGEGDTLKPLVATQNPISSQIEVISSEPLLKQVIKQLNLKDAKGNPLPVKDLQSGLTLKIAGSSDVLQIMYKANNAENATNVVNMLVKLYLENDIQTNRDEADATLQYMNSQIPATLAAVNKAEIALRQFKQNNNIVDLTEESKSAVAIIGNLETAINTNRAQLEETTAQSNELRQKLNLSSDDAMVVSAISQSPAIQANLTQLQDIDRQLAAERSRFSDDNPLVISLKEKQVNLKNLLKQQIQQTVGNRAKVSQGIFRIGDLKQDMIKDFLQSEVQRSGLTKKQKSLANSRSNYQRRMNSLPQLVQKQHQLERNLEVSQATYQTLLKKIQELQLIKNRTAPNARIVANALVPTEPQSGIKLIVIGLGILVGGLLASIIILFLERKDKSLKTIKEVNDAFGYTLLGIIPSSVKKSLPHSQRPEVTSLEIATRDTPQSVTSEMSRMIQANLRFLETEKTLQTIVVTSSVAKEGKSKVAANLAAGISQVGQRVLLIDADLRVPSQHLFWNLPCKNGLSEVLTDNAKYQIMSWKVMDNLEILTAGAKVDNPLSCLDSQQMKSLIRSAARSYDLVIIDAPPVLVAADTLALGQLVDGVLLVSKPGVIDAQHANAAREALKLSNCDVLGLIINGPIEKNEIEDHFAIVEEYSSDEKDTEVSVYNRAVDSRLFS